MLVIEAGTRRDFGELCVTGRQLRSESLLGEVPEVVKIGHALLGGPPTRDNFRAAEKSRGEDGFGPLVLFGHLRDFRRSSDSL